MLSPNALFHSLRARAVGAAIGEKQGFMKVLIGANDDRILGFTMIGSEAGEVMAVVQTAMIAGLPYSMLRDAVLTHPTMAEGLGFLLANVPARNVRPATPQSEVRGHGQLSLNQQVVGSSPTAPTKPIKNLA
jgi:Pyridine nucleotide-disulphide oxidoreductase, dimerisation domain